MARETEVLGEDLPQWRCVLHSSHMTRPRIESLPATNLLNSGTAYTVIRYS
jgi:hypothetical protein